MSVVNLEALARAYQSQENPEPEILVLGHHLPHSNYDHGLHWNAILDLGKYKGSTVRFYAPREWKYNEPTERSGGSYHFSYHDEPTIDSPPPHLRDGVETDDTHVDFGFTIPEGTIHRIIFLNPCNDGEPLPEGAEVLTENGIQDSR